MGLKGRICMAIRIYIWRRYVGVLQLYMRARKSQQISTNMEEFEGDKD